MSATWKNNIEITIFGESHGHGIGVVLGNLPAGVEIDMDAINVDLKRRAPGQNKMSTPRKEKDEVKIISGIFEGKTTGAPLMAMIENTNQLSKDYSTLKTNMRPGHSDYPAYVKYNGFNDVRGGGHFSGRLTAPIVFAGALAKQILKQKDIYVGAHMSSIKDIQDKSFSHPVTKDVLDDLLQMQYPVLDKSVFDKMKMTIENASENHDSVGGKIECAIIGMPSGIGEPFFDSVESHLASLLFSIPAVKGVHFGNPNIASLYGSVANDPYSIENDIIVTKTNNNGGILGGITTGAPIVFEVSVKPTPSISKTQNTVNVKTKENIEMEVHGRHDPCIIPRAIVVVEAMAALAMLDHMRYL